MHIGRATALVGMTLTLGLAVFCNDEKKESPAAITAPSASASVAAAPSSIAASAPKKPPAARKRKPKPTPGPELSKPTKVAPEPPSKDCGAIIVDGKSIALDCDDHVAPGEHDGVDVVPRDAIDRDPKKAGALTLPVLVDHRADGTEGPLRNQGHAGSCTCFALAAAIDHALIRHEDKPYEVSSLQLWARFHHGPGLRPIDANYGKPIASEATWPYDQLLACEWESAKACKGCDIGGKHEDCKQPVDAKLLDAANAKPYARMLHVTRLDNASTLERKRILARGQDMFFGMKVNKAAFGQAAKGDHVIGEYDPDTSDGGGHAMLIAGYRDQANGTYFLIHNSWGEKFGDGGYAWMHETMLKKGVFVVDAVPVDEIIVGANSPMKPGAACTGGMLPDSASEKCVAACPDGSARFDDHCASSECPEGEINLHGACVTAAPTTKGSVSATKVDFDCRAAGCVYTIPKGHASCEEASCMFACPAPSYLLAAGKDGAFCTE